MRNILITGGAGFIGSNLADALLAGGNKVLVIDNYATARRDSLPAHPNLTAVEGSIDDAGLVNQAFSDFHPEIVVHAAASYKDPENWAEDAKTNVLGTTHVLKASRQLGVGRLIYFQTALCYGLHPLEQPITLLHPIRPEGSSYAISKSAAEHYIELSGLDYITFRLANVYGPRNLAGPLPTFYSRLIESKPCFVVDTRRDFIFVDDLIEVVLMAVGGRGRKGAYHVSSGKDFSIKELYDAMTKAMGISGKEAEVRQRGADDVFSILLDPSKTSDDFGWKASTPLEAGIAKTVGWYKKHGISQTFTHLKPVAKE